MKEKNICKGVGFLDLLSILFIALKLIGIITWTWWWILSPISIPTIIALIGIFVKSKGGSLSEKR